MRKLDTAADTAEAPRQMRALYPRLSMRGTSVTQLRGVLITTKERQSPPT